MQEVMKLIPEYDLSDIIGSKYLFDDKPVPRVTEILSSMLHEDYLVEWANRVGLYQHKLHTEYRDIAAAIGSYTHEFIECYVQHGIEPIFSLVPDSIRYKVENTFNAFLKWWDIINKKKVKVLMQEQELVCKYFGGTLDLLLDIDDKIYLIDFKTSNYPSYKYTLQLSAYKYMLDVLYDIKVDGCIILMLNKTSPDFKEIMYYLHTEDNITYFNYCQECFFSLVYAYYCRARVESMYKQLEE